MRRIAVHAREGLIGRDHGAIGRQDQDALAGPVEQCVEAFIAYVQCMLGLLAFRDVLRNANGADGDAACREAQFAFLANPAKLGSDLDAVLMVETAAA